MQKILLAIIFMLFSVSAEASVLILKSGSKVRGKVVEENDKYVDFLTSFGTNIRYYLDEIQSIEPEDERVAAKPTVRPLVASSVEEPPVAIREKKIVISPAEILDESLQEPPQTVSRNDDDKMPPIDLDIYKVVPELRATREIQREGLEIDSGGRVNAEGYYNLGVTAAEISEYETAKINFLKAVNLDPKFADAFYNLGLVCGYLGQFNEAIEYFNRAIKLNPAPADVYYSLGEAYAGLKDFNMAQKSFEYALSIDQTLVAAQYKLGVVLAAQGNYEKAKEKLRAVTELDPKSAKAYYQLGLIASAGENNVEALVNFQKVIALDPNFPDAHYNLGVVYGVSGQYDKAVEEFQEAVVLGTKNPDAYYNLGMAHLGIAQNSVTVGTLGAYQKARESLERAKELYTTETDYDTIQKIDEILIEIPRER